jgi:hypothetical protein
MLRIPYCLESGLTDSSKTISPTHRPHSTPQKHYFPASGTHFCYRLSKAQYLVWLRGLGKLKTFIDLTGSQSCDLPACSTVPQSLHHRMPHPALYITDNTTLRNQHCNNKKFYKSGGLAQEWTTRSTAGRVKYLLIPSMVLFGRMLPNVHSSIH